MAELPLAIWWPFCFSVVILFFKKKTKFVQTVHTNFHAKYGLCSSRNEWVMLKLVFCPVPFHPIPSCTCDEPTYRAVYSMAWSQMYSTWTYPHNGDYSRVKYKSFLSKSIVFAIQKWFIPKQEQISVRSCDETCFKW